MDDVRAEPPRSEGFVAWLLRLPRWKRILLGLALLCVVVGGIFWLLSPASGGSAMRTGTGGPQGGGELGHSFVPGSGPGTGTGTAPGTPAAAATEPAAKGVFRLGFSFVAGFCIGLFVRSTLKIAAIAAGFCLVVLFALERAEFLAVRWDAIDAAWDGFWSRVGAEWGDFQTFVTGRLPAAGLAGLGLVAGFKRH